MNRKADAPHSYTLLRTSKTTHLTCIVSAGKATVQHGGDSGRTLIRMEDENHGDVYALVTCGSDYVMMRSEAEMTLCDGIGTAPAGPLASKGQITEDHRAGIPWLH